MQSLKVVAVILAMLGVIAYGSLVVGIDEADLLHRNALDQLHGGTAGTTSGSIPDLIRDYSSAMTGDIAFVSTADDAVSSNPLGVTLVATHTLQNAAGNAANWLDGLTASGAWDVTSDTLTATIAFDPADKTPTYTDGVATLTMTLAGDSGDTGTVTVMYYDETLLGDAITSGSNTVFTVGSDAYPE